jgi:hypothetical protein
VVSATRRIEVSDVPAPEMWFCWHCGAITGDVRQHKLGGYAEVMCPVGRKRVLGVPRRDLATGDGVHRR